MTRPDTTARNRRLVRMLGLLRAGYTDTEIGRLVGIHPATVRLQTPWIVANRDLLVSLVGSEDIVVCPIPKETLLRRTRHATTRFRTRTA